MHRGDSLRGCPYKSSCGGLTRQVRCPASTAVAERTTAAGAATGPFTVLLRRLAADRRRGLGQARECAHRGNPPVRCPHPATAPGRPTYRRPDSGLTPSGRGHHRRKPPGLRRMTIFRATTPAGARPPGAVTEAAGIDRGRLAENCRCHADKRLHNREPNVLNPLPRNRRNREERR